jgi:hypothetical protein
VESLRSFANAWMELKDPYMFMAAGREGAIVNITNLGVRGTDMGPSTSQLLRVAKQPLRSG